MEPKKVKITKVCECLKNTIELGKTYEVYYSKRDEYCIKVSDCLMAFVWKADAEIIENQ